jgi:hypothetical protein
MARRSIVSALALAIFLVLAVSACQGAGAIPLNQAQLLGAELAQIPPQVDAHACGDIQTNSLPRIEYQIATLPNNVSTDLRQTLATSTEHLRSLVASQCLPPPAPPAPIYTPPATTSPPSKSTRTETVNPGTRVAPPPQPSPGITTSTTPQKRAPTPPKQPTPKTDTTPSQGRGETSSGGNSQGADQGTDQNSQQQGQDHNNSSNNDQQGSKH